MKKVLTGDIKTRLEQIINEVAKQPNILIHNIIKAFKGRSSNLLQKEFPELLKLLSLWTHSYFVSTAGNVSSETIQKYIEAQNKQ